MRRFRAIVILTTSLCVGPPMAGIAEARDATGNYVRLSQRALEGPPKLASLLDRQVRRGLPLPQASTAAAIRQQMEARLAELKALRLTDPALQAQRARLTSALYGLVPSMNAVTRSLAVGDRKQVANAGNRFLTRVRSLPSAVAPASP